MKTPLKKLLTLGSVAGLALAFTSCNSVHRVDRVDTTPYNGRTVYKTGDTITVLPRGYRTVDLDGRTYYYSKGTYYQPRGSSYVVVNRPLSSRKYKYGIRSRTLPNRYQTVRYGNRNYYYSDGTYYRDGRGGYVTTKDPFGYRFR